MEPTPEAIIEEIIDPLMTGDLAETFPTIELRRVAPNAVEIDYGQPEGVYVITVEPRPRGGGTEQRAPESSTYGRAAPESASIWRTSMPSVSFHSKVQILPADSDVFVGAFWHKRHRVGAGLTVVKLFVRIGLTAAATAARTMRMRVTLYT